MNPHATADDGYPLDEDCDLPPRLLRLFLDSAPQQMRELAAHCRGKDVPNARALAHKLKGGLYVVGASRLAEQLESLSGMLERTEWGAVEGVLQTAESDFGRVVKQLAKQLG